MRKIFLYGGLLLAGYGAYEYYRTQLLILENSDFSVAGLKIKEKSANKITFAIKLRVVNKSEQEFIIKKYDLMLWLNNQSIGSVKNSNVDVTLKGFGAETFIEFDYTFNPQQIGILDVLFKLLKDRGNNTLTVRGDLSVRRGYFTFDVPIDFTYTLKELLSE